MKKYKLALLIISISIVLINCKSTNKSTTSYTKVEKKVSYVKDIKPILETSCIPCHFPPQGRKEPLDNYANVKENISSIIERITLPQDDRKSMPPKNKKPALNDSLVAVLVNWQKQNMPE